MLQIVKSDKPQASSEIPRLLWRQHDLIPPQAFAALRSYCAPEEAWLLWE